MIKNLKYDKLLKISSITIGSSINTFCSEDEIELNENSYITVDGFKTSLKGVNFKKNNEAIQTDNDLLKCFLDNFSDLDFYNVDDDNDDDNGKTLDGVFKLNDHYENNELLIYDINNLFTEIGPYNEEQIKKILNAIFTNGKLCLTLKTYQGIKIEPDFPYKLKKEFENKVKEVNKEIKTFFNIGQIKNLMERKGFVRNKISIKNGKGNEYTDNEILEINKIPVYYEDSLEPQTAEIEFIAGDGLVLDKIEKKHKIDFFKDNITEDKTIFDFITYKFKGLSGKNYKIEYFDSEDKKWYDVVEGDRFDDEDKIRITINEEISGFTKKKDIEKNKISIKFEVKDQSKYVFISSIDNISGLEIEKGKTYDDLITEINKHLMKSLNKGFKIYKNDKNTEFNSGEIENNVTYIVVFDETATDFVKEKEKGKLYINLKFEVTDNTKFKLKQNVTDKDNIEIEQGKSYNDLLGIIKQHLGGRGLKEGFKIYKNDRTTEFKSGNLENSTYIVVFVNDDINFVDKKEEPQKPDPKKTQETSNTEQNNNDDNTKKGGYSGKKGKYSNKK